VFFYYKTGGLFMFVLLLSVVSNFFLGKAIYNNTLKSVKDLWLALSLIINIAVLAFFKYDYFLTETFNSLFDTRFEIITHSAKWSNNLLGTHFSLDKILPPVGISFFTFQTISYIMDLYRKQVKPVNNILDYGFYVSFFPQLVAGPIVRASHFIPQLYKDYKLSVSEFGLALFMILQGLVKKMVFGDYIAANLIDRVFANPASYSGFENLSALYGYSLQVYFDFSGYTDIATGLALLMGFRLPQNFNQPYKALNVGDFWKRWHMSLSSWLKDYLYIPLGGNRQGSWFTYISLFVILVFFTLISGKIWLIPVFIVLAAAITLLAKFFPSIKNTITTNTNLMITMLLGGLWHGANWMFALWGGINGIGLLLYKVWNKISPRKSSNTGLSYFWKIFITFNFITFTRIWFRGESMQGTNELLQQIGNDFGWAFIPDVIIHYAKVFALMITGFILCWLPTSWKDLCKNLFVNSHIYVKIIITALVVFIIYQVFSADLQTFIYFQF